MIAAGRAWSDADAAAARGRFDARNRRRASAARSMPRPSRPAKQDRQAAVAAALQRARARRGAAVRRDAVIARLAAPAAALALLSAFAVSVRAADFSATLDAAWDFGDPAASEARFRTERAQVARRLARSARGRHADRPHAGPAPPLRRRARDARRRSPRRCRRRDRASKSATCSSAGARSTRPATRRAPSRCSARPQRAPRPIRPRGRRSITSTRCTCSASPRHRPSSSTGT